MKKVLITGGNGNLGFLVAERLAAEGVEIVRFDIPPSGREGPGAEVLGDVRDHALLASTMADHEPDAIIHLASLLSGSSEEDLDVSWEINATASFRLLRLAQDHALTGPFVFASTVATYGADLPDPLPGDTEQWPRGIYGATKVAVERLGWYFKGKHGLDFRCLRFPLVYSPFAPPSAMTAYPSHAFRAAAEGRPFTFPVSRHVGMSTLFLEDVVRSICELAKADKTRLTKPAYNLHSFCASAEDVERAIKSRWQGFQCDYAPNAAVEAMLNAGPNEIDDSDARRDWDWAPEYDFQKSAEAMFAHFGVSEGGPAES
ncbi:MAG: NAD-dependent epimerase/dehydratase family protein [Pseudomonadota bacterium]